MQALVMIGSFICAVVSATAANSQSYLDDFRARTKVQLEEFEAKSSASRLEFERRTKLIDDQLEERTRKAQSDSPPGVRIIINRGDGSPSTQVPAVTAPVGTSTSCRSGSSWPSPRIAATLASVDVRSARALALIDALRLRPRCEGPLLVFSTGDAPLAWRHIEQQDQRAIKYLIEAILIHTARSCLNKSIPSRRRSRSTRFMTSSRACT